MRMMKSLFSFFSRLFFFLIFFSFAFFLRLYFFCVFFCVDTCLFSTSFFPITRMDVDSCASPSESFISLSYLMPAFSANSFGLSCFVTERSNHNGDVFIITYMEKRRQGEGPARLVTDKFLKGSKRKLFTLYE